MTLGTTGARRDMLSVLISPMWMNTVRAVCHAYLLLAMELTRQLSGTKRQRDAVLAIDTLQMKHTQGVCDKHHGSILVVPFSALLQPCTIPAHDTRVSATKNAKSEVFAFFFKDLPGAT